MFNPPYRANPPILPVAATVDPVITTSPPAHKAYLFVIVTLVPAVGPPEIYNVAAKSYPTPELVAFNVGAPNELKIAKFPLPVDTVSVY